MTATYLQRAREAARSGYSIAESLYARNLFEVRKPNGAKYTVDVAGEQPTCNCQARVAKCKHIGLVEISRRYWLRLDRKPAPIRTRRRFSDKHLAAFRALAPTMAAPAPVQPSVGKYGSAEYKARMQQDFC